MIEMRKMISVIGMFLAVTLVTACQDDSPSVVDSNDLSVVKCPGAEEEYSCRLTTYRGRPFTGTEITGKEGSGLYRTTEFKDGLMHGKSISNISGYVYQVSNYVNGERDGESVTYHHQSEIVRNKDIYAKNIMLESTWYDESGVIESYRRYDGDKEVEHTSYTQGKVDRHTYWKDGKKMEHWFVYYPDGKVKEDTLFENFPRTLHEYEYYSNGQMKLKRLRASMSDTSEQYYYSYAGKLLSISSFGHSDLQPSDKRHGKQVDFCEETESPKSVENFKYGKKHGAFEFYNCDNGELEKKETYIEGVIAEREITNHYKDRAPIVKKDIFDKTGALKERIYYDEAGKIIQHDKY